MSRYTDIDLLLNKYQTICDGTACMDCPFNDEGCRLEKMLLEAPTVDAVPVKHGDWNEISLKWFEHFKPCKDCQEFICEGCVYESMKKVTE